MPNYHLEDLNEDAFEKLVGAICLKVLGMGYVSFAKGKDGGRDGRFEGTANKYPSEKEPLTGKFIIQAKHTGNPMASCADAEFKKILEDEALKVVKLKENGELDYYLLFTNRKFHAISGTESENYFRSITKHEKSWIIGIDPISGYLDSHPEVVQASGLHSIRSPLRIRQEDLVEVLVAFHDQKELLSSSLEKKNDEMTYTDVAEKDDLNKMNSEYSNYIEENSGPHFHKIDGFLNNPRNREYLDYFTDVADEIRAKIIVNRKNFEGFENILEHLADEFLLHDLQMKGKHRLVRVFLHYMYRHCWIGKKK